jgi:hypothetical protein
LKFTITQHHHTDFLVSESSAMAEEKFSRHLLITFIGALFAAVIGLIFAYIYNWLGISATGERISNSANGNPNPGPNNNTEKDNGQPARTFEDPLDVLSAIAGNLKKADEAERTKRRYLTLTHLHNNPRRTAADLDRARQTLNDLARYLSPEGRVAVWQPVNEEQTVFALDLGDLGWGPAEWRQVLKDYPYGLSYDENSEPRWRQAAQEVEELADASMPYARADWFLVAAVRLAGQGSLKVPAGRAIPDSVHDCIQKYAQEKLTLADAAAELPRNEPARLEDVLRNDPELRRQLEPLLTGGTVLRSVWESTESTTSPYQEASRALQMGHPSFPR